MLEKRQYKRLIPLIILLFMTLVAFYFEIHKIVDFENLKQQKENLAAFKEQHFLLSLVSMSLIYIISVSLSLPIATVLTLASGFIFGVYVGTLLVVTSATIGATILFLIAKSSIGEFLRENAKGVYARVEKEMQDNAVSYMLFMRLVPLFPFFIVNIIPALFNVNVQKFMLTTFFGIMPGSFVYVNFGAKLEEIDSLDGLLSQEFLVAAILLGCFMLLPILYKKFIAKNAK